MRLRLWSAADDPAPAADLEWPPLLGWVMLVLAIVFLAVPAIGHGLDGDLAPAVAFSGLAALPWLTQLGGRHAAPGPWIACVAVGVGYYAFNPSPQEFAPFAMVLATGEISAVHSVRAGSVAAVVFSAVMVAGELSGNYDGSFIWVSAMFVGLAAGAAYQHMVRLYTELNRAQAGLAERVAVSERQRIAREVHDVIAHSLAVTMLHVTGARMALERGDASDAAGALTEAEKLGRQSLNDVRRTVGLLADSPGVAAPPQPTATDIADLLGSYRQAGMSVTYVESGDPSALSPAAGLGLYRIAQESLANVVRHAPGAAVTVELHVGRDRATMRVANDHPRAPASSTGGGGRGIPGMKERAQLLGGSATAGPTNAGWAVEVTVPLAADDR